APITGSAAPSAESSAPDQELGRERMLLERARTALARGNASAALESLHEHKRAFSRGRMSEERDALLVQALRGLGRDDEANREADRFKVQCPKSLLSPAIQGTSP